MFVQMEKAMLSTFEMHQGFEQPILFLLPGQDRVVDADRTLEFYDRLQHPDKNIIHYHEFFHEPFNELDSVDGGKKRACEDVANWIKKQSRFQT